jgi:multidrug transporter EmrE-like cation transporter
VIAALLIGVVGTSVIHLSKGVMKLGIAGLPARRFRFIYAAGIAMNFTNPLWVILANRFAPTVYYTSMYGLGLIALLLFSRYRLGETVTRRQITGVVVIIVGTLVIGLTELGQAPPSLYSASRGRVLLVAGLWLGGAPLAALFVRRRPLPLQEIVFGVAGGGMAALEAVVKGVAQAGAIENTFLPQTGANWVLFVMSFIGAAGAFGMIQWSFLRSCRASIMGAAYNVAYVAVPLLVVPFLLGSTMINAGCIAGIATLGVGAYLVAVTPRLRLS